MNPRSVISEREKFSNFGAIFKSHPKVNVQIVKCRRQASGVTPNNSKMSTSFQTSVTRRRRVKFSWPALNPIVLSRIPYTTIFPSPPRCWSNILSNSRFLNFERFRSKNGRRILSQSHKKRSGPTSQVLNDEVQCSNRTCQVESDQQFFRRSTERHVKTANL